MNALKGLLSKAQSLADNAVAPMRDHVQPSLAQIQQQVAAIGANAAPVDGFAFTTPFSLCRCKNLFFNIDLWRHALWISIFRAPQGCRGHHAG